jgi:hypothetical protein
MRLLARSERRGRLWMVEWWAAADIFMAEGGRRATLAVDAAAILPGLVSIEEPKALSEHLERRRWRRRAERRSTEGVSGWSMTLSMMEPYDLSEGEPRVWSRNPCGMGSASSRKDCLLDGDFSSTAESPRSMSPRTSSTRRL